MDYELALRGMEIILECACSLESKYNYFSCIDDVEAGVFEGLFTFEQPGDVSKFKDFTYLRMMLERAGIVPRQSALVDSVLLLHISDKRLCVFMLRAERAGRIGTGLYCRYQDGRWSCWRFTRTGITVVESINMDSVDFLPDLLLGVIGCARGVQVNTNSRKDEFMQKMTDLCRDYSDGVSVGEKDKL